MPDTQPVIIQSPKKIKENIDPKENLNGTTYPTKEGRPGYSSFYQRFD